MRISHFILPALSVALLAAAGCNSSDSCSVSDDCFRGEACVDRVCVVPENGTNGTTTGTNSDPDMSGTGPNSSPDGSTSSDPDGGTSGLACVVDPFGNTCDDDSFEPNEDTVTFPPLLFDNQSWCASGDLLASQTTELLTFCAGDARDRFRVMIDNRSPNACVTQQFTWTTEVRIKTPCSPGDIAIDVALGALGERCLESDDFRCSWSSDGQTYTIEYVRQPEQLMDFHLTIESAEGREDVQFDYDVVVSVTQ